MFPQPPPIAEADPAQRHDEVVSLPTRLKLGHDQGQVGISVEVAPETLEKLTLKVGKAMVLGVETQTRLRLGGEWVDWGMGLSGGVALGGGTSFYPAGGKPIGTGETLEVEMEVRVFETDIPPQHHWMPQSGKYKVLHTRTLKGSIPVKPPVKAP